MLWQKLRWQLCALVVVGVLAGVLTIGSSGFGSGSTETLAVPQQSTTSDVLILGDSLCAFSRSGGYLTPQMNNHFASHDVICKVGGNLTWGRQQIQALTQVPQTVVVELGTNRMPNLTVFASEQDGLIADLRARGAKRIIWLTAHTRGTTLYYSQNDITRAAGKRLDFLISDWAYLAELHPEWYLSDTVHHTGSGMSAMAQQLRVAAQLADRSALHPGPLGPVLDHAVVDGNGVVTVTGWVVGQTQLTVSVDGLSISTLPLQFHSRPDVEAAMGLKDMTGFTLSFQLPANRTRVCVAVTGTTPSAASCQRIS